MSNYFDNKELFSTPTVSQINNHMVMSNVYKKTKTKYINIDTKFCDEYVNNRTNTSNPSYNLSQFTITLPDRINDVKSISVVNAEIPITFFNISDSLGNNFFILRSTANTVFSLVTIPDGQYTNASFITAFNSAISTAISVNFSGKSLTYDINSFNKSTFKSTSSGFTFIIDFAANKDGSFDKYNFKSKLGWLLGFRNITYQVVGASSSPTPIVSESIILLNPFSYMYLAIDEFSKGNQNGFSSAVFKSSINKNIISKIILNQQIYPFGSILPANTHFGSLMSDVRTYNGKVDIQKLNVQLIDDIGRPINLNGADFSFGIQIEYE